MLRPNLLGASRRPFFEIIRDIGLATNLRCCLDAGDGRSAPASPTTWRDRSETGSDFFLGATGAGEASDPTFNASGTVDTFSKFDFFSCDGGDYFRFATANAAWMERLHKAGAKWTVAFYLLYGDATATQGLFAAVPTGVEPGIQLITLTSTYRLYVSNIVGAALNVSSAVVLPAGGADLFFACSVDEGAAYGLFQQNATQEAFNGTYTSPTATGTSFTYEIGAAGNAIFPVANTTRFYGFMAWEGRALRPDELNKLYYATRRRFAPFA